MSNRVWRKILLAGGIVVALAVVAAAVVLGLRRGTIVAPPPPPPLVPVADYVRPAGSQILPTTMNGRRGRRPRGYNLGTETTVDSKQLLAELLAKLNRGDEESVSEAIRAIGKLETPELLAFAKQSLSQVPNAGYRRDVVVEVSGLSAKQVLPFLEQAAKDSSAEVRVAALDALTFFDARREAEVESAEKLNAEEMRGFAQMVGRAMEDSNEEVRKRALENLREFPAEVQLAGLQAALKSADKAMRTEALDLICIETNKDTVMLAMSALKDGDNAIHEKAQEVLERLVDQKFESYEAAVAWWNANSGRYNYDMLERQNPDE